MHPDRWALLENIKANPADDLARLVYADWLEENANSWHERDWVELMRLQIELAAETRVTYRAKIGRQIKFLMRGAITMRYFSPINQVLDEWRLGFRFDGWPYSAGPYSAAAFKRGFIEVVTCTMSEWLQYGPAICNVHPVQRVVITDKEPALLEAFGETVYDWYISALGWEGAASSIPFCLVAAIRVRRNASGFETIQEAKQWLSDRCIEWANQQAKQLALPV